jgi:hypothetical protein
MLSGGNTGKASSIAAASAPAATKVVYTTQPSTSATSGATLAQQPVVQLQDASSNPVAHSGVPVTISLSGTGTLGGTATVNTDGTGKATFSGLSITHSGGGTNTLSATATGLTSATSNSITVTDGSSAVGNLVSNTWASSATGQDGGAGVATGGVPTGRNFNTDTPGHNWIVANPTGSAPWLASSNNVDRQNYDHTGAPDENYPILCDPFGDFGVTISWGDTIHFRWFLWLDHPNFDPESFRKLLYVIFNPNTSSEASLVVGAYAKANNDPGWWGINQLGGGHLLPASPQGLVTANAWHECYALMKMDSSPGATDGRLTFYVDNFTTPVIDAATSYTDGSFPSSRASFLCRIIRVGQQLEGGVAAELRYLGPVAISVNAAIGAL